MNIIDIKTQKNHVFLTFEDDRTYMADAAYVLKQGLRVGDELNFERFIKDNYTFLYQTGMDSALNYLSYAPRTEKQIKDHLAKKKIAPTVAADVLEKLKDYKYADDVSYAENFVAFGADTKKGRLYLKNKLKLKGVSDTDIDRSLISYSVESENQNARAFIEKQDGLLQKYPPKIRKEKIIRKALTQGFSFEMITEAVNETVKDEDNDHFSEYFSNKIDKKCRELLKKDLSKMQIKQKLYALFLLQGASKDLIDERYLIISDFRKSDEDTIV